jgi:hypothetical protein
LDIRLTGRILPGTGRKGKVSRISLALNPYDLLKDTG